MANNSCDCPKPPGGKAVCGPDQIAVCRVKNGVVETYCITPPASMTTLSRRAINVKYEFSYDLLHKITGDDKWLDLEGEASGDEAFEILKTGKFVDLQENTVTTFSLPAEWGIVDEGNVRYST